MTYRAPQPTQEEISRLEQENFILKQELKLIKSIFNPEKISKLEEQLILLAREKEQVESLLKKHAQVETIEEKPTEVRYKKRNEQDTMETCSIISFVCLFCCGRLVCFCREITASIPSLIPHRKPPAAAVVSAHEAVKLVLPTIYRVSIDGGYTRSYVGCEAQSGTQTRKEKENGKLHG